MGGNAVYERTTSKDTHLFLSSAHLKVRQDALSPTPTHRNYVGCKETHRSSRQLRKHFETAHVNGKMRPQATPFYPKDLPLVPLPDIILPSYLIVAPPAQPFPISKDRHATFVPWVLFFF